MGKAYENVRLVVCDDPYQTNSLKEALRAFGIGNVRSCDNVSTMMRYLDDSLIDLLLYDVDTAGDALLGVTSRIRRHHQGRNPFVIVIATIADATRDTVGQLIDAGIDDLLRKPVSQDRLFGSIERFTRTRKLFATSYDFVGPSRRSANRDAADPSGLIQVPNTLLCKVTRGMDDSSVQRLVDVACFELEDRQVEAHARTLERLSGVAHATFQGQGHGDAFGSQIDLLAKTASGFRARIPVTASPQLGDLANILLSLTDRLAQPNRCKTSAATDVELLSKVSQAIRRAVTVEQSAVQLMQDIVDTVSGPATLSGDIASPPAGESC
jgi:DNA-binding response OmpR family regulator